MQHFFVYNRLGFVKPLGFLCKNIFCQSVYALRCLLHLVLKFKIYLDTSYFGHKRNFGKTKTVFPKICIVMLEQAVFDTALQ